MEIKNRNKYFDCGPMPRGDAALYLAWMYGIREAVLLMKHFNGNVLRSCHFVGKPSKAAIENAKRIAIGQRARIAR